VQIGQKFNSDAIINGMLFDNGGLASQFEYSFVQDDWLLLVHPLLQSQVKQLEVEFTRGYQQGDHIFYVSTMNDKKLFKLVTSKIIET